MQDDPIVVDAEFHPHQSKDPRRGVPRFVIAALVAVAGLFGWFLASPYSVAPEEPEAATSTTDASTTTTTMTAAAVVAPPVAPSASAELSQVLSDAIPGFTDKIVMLATPPESFRVIRWLSSERETEVMLSLDRIAEYGSSPVGLDPSGRWFADVRREGILTVHSVPDARDSALGREAIGLGVSSAVWHDTDAGSLAWIACGRPESDPATLFTLDVSDPEAAPTAVRTFDENCAEWSGGASLVRWNESGFLVGNAEGVSDEHLFVGLDGAVVDLENAAPPLVTDTDGRVRPVIPGLADDEPLDDVAWSPDGSLAAVIIDEPWDTEEPKLRVTGIEGGEAFTEVAEHGAVVFAMAWSTDSRFLLYELWDFEADSGALVFYDTVTNATFRTPLAAIVDEIRSVPSAS
jgi:hypothetical protein